MHGLSDMSIRLRNALEIKKTHVEIKKTKLVLAITDLLYREGFIEKYDVQQDNIKITFKYLGKKKKSSLNHFEPISKPSLRVYRAAHNVPTMFGGMGLTIVSTSKGVLTQREAEFLGLGGEIICYVW